MSLRQFKRNFIFVLKQHQGPKNHLSYKLMQEMHQECKHLERNLNLFRNLNSSYEKTFSRHISLLGKEACAKATEITWAQVRTRPKPPPTIPANPSSNLWAIQMWGEALDERPHWENVHCHWSWLSGDTDVCTQGEGFKFNKTLLQRVTWCALWLRSVIKCISFWLE